MKERLQKVLSKSGHGSRRACEELIIQGRVKINDKTAEIGEKADPIVDLITLDGEKISSIPSKKIYIALHKPRGVLSEVNSQDNRLGLKSLLNINEQLICVGRLDKNSEGLILLTNDGDLTYQLTHPSFTHEKEYRVLVSRYPDEKKLDSWRKGGIVLEDGYLTSPAKVYIERQEDKNVWLRVIMHEGRKRQIRQVGAQLGLPVQRIIRIRIGNLELNDLKPGEWRYLSNKEIVRLMELVEPH